MEKLKLEILTTIRLVYNLIKIKPEYENIYFVHFCLMLGKNYDIINIVEI